MYECDNFGVRILFQHVFHFLRVDRIAPFILHHQWNPATALNIFNHPPAKDAISAHDNLVSGHDHIDETHFHTDRTRP
nr:hypothetical protein [Nitrosomonas sp.]